jgi:hypothetical protein
MLKIPESLNSPGCDEHIFQRGFTNTKNSSKISHNSKWTPGMSTVTSGSRVMKKESKNHLTLALSARIY